MTITIGRIGLSTANGGDGFTLADPLTIDMDGDTLAISGLVHTAQTGAITQAEILHLAGQLAGLVGPGREPVIPITCTSAPELDGFYMVESAGITHDQGALGGSTVWAPWRVTARKIPDWARPAHESIVSTGLLTNVVGLTTWTVRTGVPVGATDWVPRDLLFGSGAITGTTPSSEGTMQVHMDNGVVTAQAKTGRYLCPPGTAYQAGCRAERDVSGGGLWRTLVGRQPVVTPIAGRIRISNGLVRVTINGTALQVACWDGTQWDAPTSFNVGNQAGVLYSTATSTVIVNTPETVTLRCTLSLGSPGLAATLDVSLRRGSRVIAFRPIASSALQWRFQWAPTAPAATAGTGILTENANNAAGNRHAIYSYSAATTVDAANGRITLNASATSALFHLGVERNGTGSASPDRLTDLGSEVVGTTSETVRLVTI